MILIRGFCYKIILAALQATHYELRRINYDLKSEK